ncbi:hypothetical protein [Mesorhizobium sp. Pch-S]|uniref:hypothetical protein n=2 Tax=Mesorhizobium sp. Pch-S TaxID=2082387 RepID=UPI00101367FF|nr:hypothetical protein [Mesorhizobium sp. Pch-S]QAZ46747.1 hypothetical protein C1M53_31330 [Mesorhizobium sp. Pch-S]
MLEWYHWTLITMAVLAAACAWHLPRAVFWIALGALSYVTSAWWHNAGLPYGAAYGMATNLAICLAIYSLAQQRWELRTWNMFHAMILLDILYLAGIIKTQLLFAVSLEVVNAAALLLIAATGIMDRAGYARLRSGSYRGRRLFGLARALFSKRNHPPFWQVK